MLLAESDIIGLSISCINTFTNRSRPSAVTSSASENISNCILIYFFELVKNIEEESIVISDFIQGPDSLSDSNIWKLNVGISLPR